MAKEKKFMAPQTQKVDDKKESGAKTPAELKEILVALVNSYAAAKVSADPLLLEYSQKNLKEFVSKVEISISGSLPS